MLGVGDGFYKTRRQCSDGGGVTINFPCRYWMQFKKRRLYYCNTHTRARALWCWRLWTWGYYANLLSRLSRILMYTEKVASVGGLPSPPLGHFICLPPVYLARILSTFPCLSLCIRICICFSNSLSLIQRLCFSFSPSSSLVSPITASSLKFSQHLLRVLLLLLRLVPSLSLFLFPSLVVLRY